MPGNLKEIVAKHWSNIDTEGQFGKNVYWLANPIVQRSYIKKAVGGKDYPHWLNYCVEWYLKKRCPVDEMLSVGCGAGPLERHLAKLNAFKHMDAFDIAPTSIDLAKKASEKEGITSINYMVRDAEACGFPAKTYDAIFFNSSLHHMSKMDQIVSQTASALKPDGFLFINEYIGPNRFDLSEREKEVIQAVYTLIPERYRVSLSKNNFGALQNKVQFPNPIDVANVDPSEAVCSQEIVPTIEKYFKIIEFNKLGGTALQFLLQNIAGHFREEDPDSKAVLELILKAEETLISVGDLSTHFAFIVACKKDTGGKLRETL